MESAVH
jgi:hypothetical protein